MTLGPRNWSWNADLPDQNHQEKIGVGPLAALFFDTKTGMSGDGRGSWLHHASV
jgi:hypothetical protein